MNFKKFSGFCYNLFYFLAERNSGTSEWLSDVYSNGLNDESSINLAVAASIVEDIRSEVFKKTGFRCSAGIAHNKVIQYFVCYIV